MPRPLPIINVSQYSEGEEGNATILVELNSVKIIVVLENGTRVGIATKFIWIKWGKLDLRMVLQFENSIIEKRNGYLLWNRI